MCVCILYIYIEREREGEREQKSSSIVIGKGFSNCEGSYSRSVALARLVRSNAGWGLGPQPSTLSRKASASGFTPVLEGFILHNLCIIFVKLYVVYEGHESTMCNGIHEYIHM